VSKKLFIIAWGDGYRHEHQTVTNPDAFFSKDNGFNEDDIEKIGALKVAECWTANDGTDCSVMRLTDVC
jgi:hypothetical protein